MPYVKDTRRALVRRPGEEARDMNTEIKPTPDQLAAVRAFAAKHGRGWKVKLFDKWMAATDVREPNGHLLRQVRNQFGPKWLAKWEG